MDELCQSDLPQIPFIFPFSVRESAPVTDKGDLIRGKDELPGMRIETTSTSQSVPPNVGRNEL